MDDLVIKIAGIPPDIEELDQRLSDQITELAVSIKRQSVDRDISVVEIVITAAASGAVKLVLDLVKAYITEKFIKSDAKKDSSQFAIQVQDAQVSISKEEELENLDRAFASVGNL